MSLMNSKKPQGAAEDSDELTGSGIGERIDFLGQDNHIFINKLNFICKNYDTNFKDVKRMKKIMEDSILTSLEKQRLVLNETSDKVDYLQSKVLTIENHLPVMIQEILEFYFEKKVGDLLSQLVTKDNFKKALSVKLDN